MLGKFFADKFFCGAFESHQYQQNVNQNFQPCSNGNCIMNGEVNDLLLSLIEGFQVLLSGVMFTAAKIEIPGIPIDAARYGNRMS